MSSSPTTRFTLLSRLKDRDDASAWDEFVRMYTPLIKRVALQRGLQEADASEVVQEVLLSVLNSLASFSRGARTGSFRKWLSTIAKNKTLNRLTRKPIEERQRTLDHSSSDIVNIAIAREPHDQSFDLEWRRQLFVLAAEQVRRTVQPQTWSAFWLTAVDEQPAEVVAAELSMDLGAVYVARSRTLAKIRNWIRSHSKLWEEQ